MGSLFKLRVLTIAQVGVGRFDVSSGVRLGGHASLKAG